ncbi:MAG: G-D-S-L family lipolytic protein [Ferruginibacter sp.]|nr:G-D-S-L family lipolytic protein [Ferruginibacter sp.]
MKKKLTGIFILLMACNVLWSQDSLLPFYKEIQNFKKQDNKSFPSKKAILFIGSSSFTRWEDMQDYFPAHKIINRGFGGSSLPDVIRYANDIIFPYHPKQIIIYCGENDLAGADSVTSKIVFNRFRQLFQLIRNRMPLVSIAYVSMKPSPSREKLWPKMVEGNSLIKNYLLTKKQTAFIDVYHKMFNKDGKVMSEIFTSDNLHMNAKGYAIWQKIIEPYLLH